MLGKFARDACHGCLKPPLLIRCRPGFDLAFGRRSFELLDKLAGCISTVGVEAAEPGLLTPNERAHKFARLAHDVLRMAFACSELIDRISLGRKHPGHGRIDGHASIRLGAHATIVEGGRPSRHSY